MIRKKKFKNSFNICRMDADDYYGEIM